MQNEYSTNAWIVLVDLLFPSIDSVRPDILEVWRAGELPEDLREDMLANDYLRVPILEDLLIRVAVEKDDFLCSDSQLDELLNALDQPLVPWARRVGAVWHANEISHIATSGQVRTKLPDMTAKDVRFALAQKRLDGANGLLGENPQAQIVEDGLDAIYTWLVQFGPQILALIGLQDSDWTMLSMDRKARPELLASVNACLSDMLEAA